MVGFYIKGACFSDATSVIGFDDLEIPRHLPPTLTTIRKQTSLQWQKAVELLLEIIGNPDLSRKEAILSLHLVERGSVKQMVDLESWQGKRR